MTTSFRFLCVIIGMLRVFVIYCLKSSSIMQLPLSVFQSYSAICQFLHIWTNSGIKLEQVLRCPSCRLKAQKSTVKISRKVLLLKCLFVTVDVVLCCVTAGACLWVEHRNMSVSDWRWAETSDSHGCRWPRWRRQHQQHETHHVWARH